VGKIQNEVSELSSKKRGIIRAENSHRGSWREIWYDAGFPRRHIVGPQWISSIYIYFFGIFFFFLLFFFFFFVDRKCGDEELPGVMSDFKPVRSSSPEHIHSAKMLPCPSAVDFVH
jgi:hypothetical protein